MKRTKPAATPSTHPVQPEEKSSSAPEHSESGSSPSPDPSDEQQTHSAKPEAIPLGLATTESSPPPNPTAPASTGPGAESSSRPSVERTAVPPILLEGDEPKPGPESSSAHKSIGSAAAPPAQTPAQELPESYGTGRLLLTARDPNCLYAHWDLTAEQQQGHLNLSAQKQLSLRVHSESLSGPVVSEVHVPPQAHHSFVPVDAPEARRFLAELGYYAAEGSWKTVAAAETTAVRPASAAQTEPVRFMTLAFGSQEPASPARPPQSHQVTRDAAKLEMAVSAGNFPLPKPLAVFMGPARWSTENQIVPPEEPQSWQDIPGDQEALAAFGDLVDEQVVDRAGTPGRVLTRLGTQWTAAQERALAELIGWSVIRSESLGSEGIEELIRGIRQAEVAAPNELSSLRLAAAPEELSSIALGQAPTGAQGFWFNVNAELVIYGATQPGATVTVAGRPIALRPDGTFSYRFALPDGSYQLPLAAHSTRGENREAVLSFQRSTGYSEGAGTIPQDPGLKPPTVENIT